MSQFFQSISDLLSQERERLQSIADIVAGTCNRLGKPVEITVDVTDQLGFSAFAERLNVVDAKVPGGKRGGHYRICISEGLIVRLAYALEIALQILARIEQRSDGYPVEVIIHERQHEEAAVLLPVNNFFGLSLSNGLIGASADDVAGLALNIEDHFWPFQLGSAPIGERAKFYLDKALEFLILHEGSHVARGHLDYLDDAHLIPIMPEDSLPVAAGLEPEMLQVMEIDADLQAMTTQYSLILTHEFGDDSKTYARILMTAYGVLFSLFDLRARTASSYRRATHPDPDMRLQLAWSYLSRMLAGETGKSFDTLFSETLMDAVVPIRRMLGELGVGGGAFHLFVSGKHDHSASDAIRAYSDWYFKASLSFQELWVDRASTSSSDAFERFRINAGEKE